MAINSFEDDCRALSKELVAYAERTRPGWSAFPTTVDRKSERRIELNKRIKDAQGNVLICQYEFTPDGTAVALYLTMLGSKAEAACDALDRAKASIEQELGAKSSWKEKKNTGKRVRFSIPVPPIVDVRAPGYTGDPRVPHLVDLMWRFQEVTFPLIGF